VVIRRGPLSAARVRRLIAQAAAGS